MAVVKANNWQHLDIQCLPAEWHNFPQRIVPAVEEKILRLKDRYRHIFVAYADCGTGGRLDELLGRHAIERLPGDHCYAFFAGQGLFDRMADAEPGTFYLTDYLVDHFQRLIMDGLGITQHPELRHEYFRHYKRLTYLRQDLRSDKSRARLRKAENAALALQLPLQIHDTGLDVFLDSLNTIRVAAA